MIPKISIIVPIYKVEKYLRRCLDSIVAQTFTDWECILVDDGSPDNSGKICDEYAEKDKRFRVFHQDNAGVSAARNKGLDEAKGEWIGFVDSDDWIETNMYEYLYNDALETKSDVVICGFVGQHKKRIQKMYGSEEAVKLLFDPNGVDGILVPANDPWQMANAILELSKDTVRLIQYSKNSQEIAKERHNPKSILKQLLDCYNTVIKSHQ